MGIGEKIHRIRNDRGYTADQFAEMLGISAVSLRKYEYGERTPKGSMVEQIARCLEVDPATLKADWGECANDAVHVLFDMEEAFCLEPVKVGDSVVLALPEDVSDEEQEALAKALRDWYKAKRDLDEGEMERSEYVAWKDSFKA